MTTHEAKKDCKILDEILLYLMKKHIECFDIHFEYTNQEVSYIIKTKPLDKDTISFMKEHINQKRELEIEEYAWELMGESDCQSELNLVGLLIDEISVDESDISTTLTLKRRKK